MRRFLVRFDQPQPNADVRGSHSSALVWERYLTVVDDRRRPVSPLVNAFWGSGIQVQRVSREQWRAFAPWFALVVAATVTPVAVVGIVVDRLVNLGWGAASAVMTYAIAMGLTAAIAYQHDRRKVQDAMHRKP